MTRVGTSVGTFGYAAPEQLQGRVGRRVSIRSWVDDFVYHERVPAEAFPKQRLKITFREGLSTIETSSVSIFY